MAKKIVVDSSVIVKWLSQSGEDHIVQADNLLKDAHEGKADLFAPELAKYEIGKALFINKKLSQTESKIPLSTLYELPIQFIVQSQELSKESYAIASAFGLTYYEGVFLALSEQKSAVLVTAIINEKAQATGTTIIALKDY